jgi:signal transduction histidine kinase
MPALQLISNDHNKTNSVLSSQRMLDDARALAMEKVLNGGVLDPSLKMITTSLSEVLGSCHCQTILFDSKKQIFRALNKTSTQHPSLVAKIIEQVLNPSQEKAGKSIRQGKNVFYPDIYDSSTWKSIYIEAKEIGIVGSWIIPILSANGSLKGVFVTLFKTLRRPDEHELRLLQRAGDSVAALISHCKHKAKTLQEKVAVQQDYLAQKAIAEESNSLLKKAIEQRSEVQGQLLELENMAALGTMMSSLTHEINTPIGVSLTAASFLSDMQEDCIDKLQNEQLKRSELVAYLKESVEAAQIIERNMLRAVGLIKTFKRLSVDQDSQDTRTFNLCDYVYEVLLSLKPRLKHTPHKFCIDIPTDLDITSNPGALSQLLINLIMNSTHHAFSDGVEGKITIKAGVEANAFNGQNLILSYKDNGVGMNKQTIENMYKPFFSLARETDGCGLGMHICNNIVMKVLRGAIDCRSELGKGVEFTIIFPV